MSMEESSELFDDISLAENDAGVPAVTTTIESSPTLPGNSPGIDGSYQTITAISLQPLCSCLAIAMQSLAIAVQCLSIRCVIAIQSLAIVVESLNIHLAITI
jgi:hypothetical protein